MTVDIRPAQPTDMPDIVEVLPPVMASGYAKDLEEKELDEEAEKRRAFDWSRGVTTDQASVFVALGAQGTGGVLQADLQLPAPRDLPEITMLHVDPCAWGTELARALQTHHRARRFYEHEGWTVDGGIEPAANNFFRLVYYHRHLRR